MAEDQLASDILYSKQVYRATERAMERAASAVHADLKQGLNTLATITCVAPFVGLLGTLWAIGFDTFFGIGTDKYTALAMVAKGISRACVPTALVLFVGLHSLWAYQYLRDRLSGFDREMSEAPLSLINQLALTFGRLRPSYSLESVSHSLPYLEAYSPDSNADNSYKRRIALVAVSSVLVAWCLQVGAYFLLDTIPLNSAIFAGLRSIVIVFCCACLPAYAVWVDLLRRKPSGVIPLAAALCLLWCVAGLFLPAIRF